MNQVFGGGQRSTRSSLAACIEPSGNGSPENHQRIASRAYFVAGLRSLTLR